MSYPLEQTATCRLKDVPFHDAMLLVALGALALLTLEVAGVILVDFIGRMRNKNRTSILRRWDILRKS